MAEDIPGSALCHFIAQCIGSVEQLEILCHLSEAAQYSWSVAEVLRRVQSSEQSVTDCLARFLERGLVRHEPPGRYRFAPQTAELTRAAAALVRAYRERRVSVIEMIYRKPGEAPSASPGPEAHKQS